MQHTVYYYYYYSKSSHKAQVMMECMTDSVCFFCRSVRLWIVGTTKHKNLVKPKTAQGKKNIPTTCTFSKDGKLIATACQDGSIQMWDYKRYVNVAKVYRNAHMNGTETSSLCFSYDGMSVASRGGRYTHDYFHDFR